MTTKRPTVERFAVFRCGTGVPPMPAGATSASGLGGFSQVEEAKQFASILLLIPSSYQFVSADVVLAFFQLIEAVDLRGMEAIEHVWTSINLDTSSYIES